MNTFGLIFLKAFIIAVGRALADAVIALIYNLVASLMGGLKIDIKSLLQIAPINPGKQI